MKKAFTDLKNKIATFIGKHPKLVIGSILFLFVYISFSLTYTITLKFKDNKWDLEITKRELKVNDLTGKKKE